MSDSPESVTKQSSTNDSETSSGFRSFWRRSGRGSQSQDVTFIQQDPASKWRSNRLSRFLKHGSTASSGGDGDDGEESSQKSAQKRRQQVYQAQKRHRNRKAEYVQNLEAEIARLQHLDSLVHSEKNSLAHQNNAIREFLASQSVDVQLESVNLSSTSQPTEELSQLGALAVDIRFDPELGQDRTFLDFADLSDMLWTSDETSPDEGQPKRPAQQEPVAGDSWAALDFVLALEWPCREHIKHHAINPEAKVPEACSIGQFHGHALTATAAVYQSAQPPASSSRGQASSMPDNMANQAGLDLSTLDKWQLPHSEIDKLVELSEMLELDEESMTPAQAYSAVRETVPSDDFLRPVLDALKKPLGSLVQCHGFGACMDAAMFWQHLDGTIQSLQFTRPDLGHGTGQLQA